jgi:uncharacterized protein (DUF4415 family)
MAKAKVRAVLVDGKPYQRKADGSLVPLKGKTDWKRLDRQTSVQTETIAANDRDGRPMSDGEWAKAEIIQPQKVPVGLKLDHDVLGWFKSQGKGYQTRINTIAITRPIVRLVSAALVQLSSSSGSAAASVSLAWAMNRSASFFVSRMRSSMSRRNRSRSSLSPPPEGLAAVAA